MKLDEYTNTIRHIGLVVKDINKSIHFWCEMLGFKIISDQLESGKNLSKILCLEEKRLQKEKFYLTPNLAISKLLSL